MAGIAKSRWLELSPLLDELLDAPAAGRAERLAQIRTRDRSLGDELAALLAQQAAVETAQFLEGSALASPDAPSLENQVVGNYTLERELGQGGMGSVWLARRSDGRYEGHAAVKFLSLAQLGKGGLERFRREGSVLARLAHPNIARLLDAGVYGGQPYLVLEYVEGEPLDRWCDGRHLDVRARVRLLLDVMDAVGHAHVNLILHRDLKPTNILVTPQGAPKLLDFGIAKLIGEPGEPREAGAAQPTQVFTPEYAAPEQAQGDDVTTATDVYALAVLLYVLVTGAHPTARPGGNTVDHLRALIEAEPPLASDMAKRSTPLVAAARASAPEQLARTLRGDLDTILRRALKKAPAERYPTVAAFADDLRRYLADEPVSARPDSMAYRVGKFVRRHRNLVAAASVAVVALVAGVIGTTWQAVEARRAQARAEENAREAARQKDEAEFEARVARANHEFLSQVFGDAMRGGETAVMRQRLDRARELLRRRYANDPEVHAILLLQVAGRYAELGDAQREADVLAETDALAEKSGRKGLQGAMQCIHAYDLIIDRKLDEAAAVLARGIALVKEETERQGMADFECVRADAMLAALRNDPRRAEQLMNDYIALLEKQGKRRTRLYTSSVGSLAYVQMLAGEYAPALASTLRSMALDQELGSDQTIASTVDAERAALLALELGRFAESARYNVRYLQIFEQGGEAPSSKARGSFARRAIIVGFPGEAAKHLRELAPQFEKAGPEANARGALLDLAEAEWQLGRVNEAAAVLQRAERRFAQGQGKPSDQDRSDAARLRGLLALERGDRAGARAAAAEIEAVLNSPGNLRRFMRLRARLAVAYLTLRAGDAAHARDLAEAALKDARDKVPADQPNAWAGVAHLLLAHALAAGGAAEPARQNHEAARREIDGSTPPEHPLRQWAALPLRTD